jgi:hypothetical protein
VSDLSARTSALIDLLFPAQERETVYQILAEECGQNLPFMQDAGDLSLERVRFAVLKISQGDPDRLLEAVFLAQQDWRDVLVAAAFEYDLEAHQDWAHTLLSAG